MLRELDGLGDSVRMGGGEHLGDAAVLERLTCEEPVVGAVRIAVIADDGREDDHVIGRRLLCAPAEDLKEAAVLRVAEVLSADLRGEDLEGLPAAEHDLREDGGLHLLASVRGGGVKASGVNITHRSALPQC